MMKRTLRFFILLAILLAATFATQSALVGSCPQVMPGVADPCPN